MEGGGGRGGVQMFVEQIPIIRYVDMLLRLQELFILHINFASKRLAPSDVQMVSLASNFESCTIMAQNLMYVVYYKFRHEAKAAYSQNTIQYYLI